MRPVAVLGTSLESLLAAHAVAVHERPVALFGRAITGEIGQWCGWSPWPIPFTIHHIDKPNGRVDFVDHGSEDVYRQKSGIGDDDQLRAWQSTAALDVGWDLTDLYLWLQEQFAGKVNEMIVNVRSVQELVDSGDFSLCISGVQAVSLCRTHAGVDEESAMCRFSQHQVKSAPVTMHNGEHPHQIIRDGTRDHSWFRTISAFGHKRTDWPPDLSPPIPEITTRTIPTRTNCRCFSDIVRVGQYGMWRRGVRPYEAFDQATKAVLSSST